MEERVTGMEQERTEEDAAFRVSNIVSEYPAAYQQCVKGRLDEVETALDNFILSLVF